MERSSGSEPAETQRVAVRREWLPVLLSATSFFFVIGSFSVLRPLRDSFVSSGQIPNLLTIVLLTMLVATPVFGAVATMIPRKHITPIVFLFFASHLIGFFVALSLGVAAGDVASVFFVWLSVFNLFLVAAFWVLMADIFRPDQAIRLFAGISLGGTLGGIFAPIFASLLVERIGLEGILLLSYALVLLALCFGLGARATAGDSAAHQQQSLAIGHSFLSGITNILGSPYLTAIVVWVLAGHLLMTFSYLQLQELMQQAVTVPAERFALFAQIDASANVVAGAIQVLVATRFIRSFGAGAALAGSAIVAAAGFLTFSLLPVLAVAIGLQATLRAVYFGMSLPMRHMLFSVVSIDEKYKSQSFVDTVVQRGGDAAGGWAFSSLFRDDKLDLSAIAAYAAALAASWAMLGLAVGRMLERKAGAIATPGDSGPVDGRIRVTI